MIRKWIIYSVKLVLLLIAAIPGYSIPQTKGWKAGVASTIITPGTSMWMAGFSSRERPSEGKLHDLWAKALVLEDAAGHRSVLIATELSGIPRDISNRVRDQLKIKYGFTKAQIIINTSHTHSGPVLHNALPDIYPMDEEQKEKSRIYTIKLERQLIDLVGKAIKSLEPVKIYAQNGITRFQVNRRNNKEAALDHQTELNGPNDYAVPVIKVVNSKGKLKAIAFGYACHATVLSLYQWSGDYPGFAQIELEKRYPGTTAIFFQGAGGDQNGLPRNSVPIAKQYGKELAAAVERVLEENMRELDPALITAYTEIDLPLDTPPTIAELEKMNKEFTGFQQRWATRILQNAKQGTPFPTSYPYPLQIWRLGEQPVIALGGEPVIQYAINFKRIYGSDLFVMGYSNDVMCYIPSEKVWQEGGYEGALAYRAFGLTSRWAEGVEARIIKEMKKLANTAGLKALE